MALNASPNTAVTVGGGPDGRPCIEANAGNAAFLKGLCSIAHNIGLQVLAEGVTTQIEWNTIKALGFDGATGPGVREPQS